MGTETNGPGAEGVRPEQVATRLRLDSSQFGHRIQALGMSDARAFREIRHLLELLLDKGGFAVGGVSVVRSDGHLQMAVVVGTDLTPDEVDQMVVPPERWAAAFDDSEVHGGWHFKREPDANDSTVDYSWVPEIPEAQDPGAWDAYSALNYPIRDAADDLVAMIGLDVPIDGRVPTGDRWESLDDLGSLAARAIQAILERERQAERAHVAEAARTVLRRARADLSPARAFELATPEIQRGLSADVVEYGLFEPSDRPGPTSLIALCETALIQRWCHGGGAFELTSDPATIREVVSSPVSAQRADAIVEALGLRSALLVPVGSGPECLGGLLVARTTERAPWSAVETRAVAEIAGDLGRTIAAFRTQRRERQLVVDMQRLADYKSRLVATVSHDLVSPISAIRLHLDLVAQVDDADLVARSVGAMKRATRELLDSVEGLVALYRAEGARVPQMRFDGRDVVASAIEVHRPIAEEAGLTLIDRSSPGPVSLFGERSEIGRVIANLIGNAIKYTPSGSVTVELCRDGPDAVFTCQDTGIGMSRGDQERIFEEFFRSEDPLTRDVPGTGLGMSIVARIVEAHDGTVRIESAPGEGTLVEVRLPIG